jgi:hypothetical protein
MVATLNRGLFIKETNMKTLKYTLTALAILGTATTAFAGGGGSEQTVAHQAARYNDSSDTYVPAQRDTTYAQPVFTPGILFVAPGSASTANQRSDREGEGASHR